MKIKQIIHYYRLSDKEKTSQLCTLEQSGARKIYLAEVKKNILKFKEMLLKNDFTYNEQHHYFESKCNAAVTDTTDTDVNINSTRINSFFKFDTTLTTLMPKLARNKIAELNKKTGKIIVHFNEVVLNCLKIRSLKDLSSKLLEINNILENTYLHDVPLTLNPLTICQLINHIQQLECYLKIDRIGSGNQHLETFINAVRLKINSFIHQNLRKYSFSCSNNELISLSYNELKLPPHHITARIILDLYSLKHDHIYESIKAKNSSIPTPKNSHKRRKTNIISSETTHNDSNSNYQQIDALHFLGFSPHETPNPEITTNEQVDPAFYKAISNMPGVTGFDTSNFDPNIIYQ